MGTPVAMTVNGRPVKADLDPRTLLAEFLRDHLRLTGTHIGCDTGQCGACTVHVDGRAVKSCNLLAAQAQVRERFNWPAIAQRVIDGLREASPRNR